jgi:hypothetical protein
MKKNEEKIEVKEEEIFGITEEELEESKSEEEVDDNVSGKSE